MGLRPRKKIPPSLLVRIRTSTNPKTLYPSTLIVKNDTKHFNKLEFIIETKKNRSVKNLEHIG